MLGHGGIPMFASSAEGSAGGILKNAVGGGQSLALATKRSGLQYFGQRRIEEAISAKLRQACRQAKGSTPAKSDRSIADPGRKGPQDPARPEGRSSEKNRRGVRFAETNKDLQKPHDDDHQPIDARAIAAKVATDLVSTEAQHGWEIRQKPVLLGNRSSAHNHPQEISKVVLETDVAYLRDIELRLANELMKRSQILAARLQLSTALGASAFEPSLAPWQLDEHMTPWLSVSNIDKQTPSYTCPDMPLLYTRLVL